MSDKILEFRAAAQQYVESQSNLMQTGCEMITSILQEDPKYGILSKYSVFISTTNESILSVSLLQVNNNNKLVIETEFGNYKHIHELDYDTFYDLCITVMTQYIAK